MDVAGHVSGYRIVCFLFPDIGKPFMFGFFHGLGIGFIATKRIKKEDAIIGQRLAYGLEVFKERVPLLEKLIAEIHRQDDICETRASFQYILVEQLNPAKLILIEVKIWGRNDYRKVQEQIESYWSADVAAGAVGSGLAHTLQAQHLAIGDALGPEKIMLAHVASAEGIIAAENAMGGNRNMNYDAVPGAIYTLPEVANVGLTESQAHQKGLDVRADTVLFRTIGKAQVIGELTIANGILKKLQEYPD